MFDKLVDWEIHLSLLICTFFYWPGNYLKFYEAIKHTYPDIQIISNCDGSKHQLDHPADLYDFHVILIFFNYFCFQF